MSTLASELSVAATVERAAAGDKAAFAWIVAAHRDDGARGVPGGRGLGSMAALALCVDPTVVNGSGGITTVVGTIAP